MISTTQLFRHFYEFQLGVPETNYFAVPPGVPYDSYEKLILPFDLLTWILTFVTFLITFIVIFIVNRMKVEAKNFVFGTNVAAPFLNALAHFFGLGQLKLPKRNFARFILMFFIFFSFMVRNLYQGIMCEYLQKDLRSHEPIQTVEDMVDPAFKLYCTMEHDDPAKLKKTWASVELKAKRWVFNFSGIHRLIQAKKNSNFYFIAKMFLELL